MSAVVRLLIVTPLVIISAIHANLRHKSCGELQITLPSSWDRESPCSHSKSISFDTCKLLLLNSSKCNALTYTHAQCTLFLRNSSNHSQELTLGRRHGTLHVIRLDHEIDNCMNNTQGVLVSAQSANRQFHMCLANESSNIYRLSPTFSEWLSLPRLGIVITVTSDWLSKNQYEMERVSNNFECYARTHNYSFVSTPGFSASLLITPSSSASACPPSYIRLPIFSLAPPSCCAHFPPQVQISSDPRR